MILPKYIVTKIDKAEENYTMFSGQPVECGPYGDIFGMGEPGLKIGDIVVYKQNHPSAYTFVKRDLSNCETAIVMNSETLNGTRVIMAFCVKYGDIQIKLASKNFSDYGFISPYFYIKRGDEILVSKQGNNFQIEANKTIDKLRTDFITRQK